MEIITSDWDPIIANLLNSDFDIIMSAMTITSERQNLIDFSIPYFKDTLGLLVQPGNPLSINSISDANSTVVKIGVVSGTSSDVWVQSNLPNAQKLSFTNNLNLYQALTNGDVDVIISEWYMIGRDTVTGVLDAEMVDYGFEGDSSFGIGVRKGEVRFLSILNDAITTMFFDGTYANITAAWFGQTGLIGATFVDSVTITGTESSTMTYSVTETSLEVTTSTFIDSKAEVLFNPMISWVVLIIGLPAYIIRKRK